jgi:hypothetical protein
MSVNAVRKVVIFADGEEHKMKVADESVTESAYQYILNHRTILLDAFSVGNLGEFWRFILLCWQHTSSSTALTTFKKHYN